MRTIFFGDTHGMLEELTLLVRRLRVQPEDRVILVGDLVDRGPDSAGVVKFVMDRGFESVLGNHDEKMARYRKWERKIASGEATKNPMRMSDDKVEVYNSLTEEQLDWMSNLPPVINLFVKGQPFLVVHGGFETTGQHPEKQNIKKVIRVRHVNPEGYMTGRPDHVPDDAVPWMIKWNWPFNVVYGHAVHSLETPRIDVTPLGFKCFGIDTGACFGGKLTALVFDDDSGTHYGIESVKAKKAYASLHDAE